MKKERIPDPISEIKEELSLVESLVSDLRGTIGVSSWISKGYQ